MSDDSFYGFLAKSIWNHVGLAYIFCAGLILLFVDKVPQAIKEHLLPALIVFGLGFIFIGYIEGSIFRKNFDREGSEKRLHPYKRLFFINLAWFSIFIAYLFYRNVL